MTTITNDNNLGENTPLKSSENKNDEEMEENFLTDFLIQDIKLIDAYRKSLNLSVYKMLVDIGHDVDGSLIKNGIRYYNYSYNEDLDNLEDLGYGVKSYFIFHKYILVNLLIMSIFAISYMFFIFFKSYKSLRRECESFFNYDNFDSFDSFDSYDEENLNHYQKIFSLCENYFEEETFTLKNMNIFSILSGKIYLDYISYNKEIPIDHIYYNKHETNKFAFIMNLLHFFPFFILLIVNIIFIKISLENYIFYKVRHRSQTDFACLIENIPDEYIKPNENEEKEFENIQTENEKEIKRNEIYKKKKRRIKKLFK